MYDVIWRPFWNFAYKNVAYGCQCGNYTTLKGSLVLRKSVNNRYQSMSVEVLFIVPFEQRTYSSVHMMHIKHVLLL